MPRAQNKILQRCDEDIALAGVLRGTYVQRFSSQPLSIQLEGDASLTQVRCLTVATLTRSLKRSAHDCVGALDVSRSLENLQLTCSAVSYDCRKSASMAYITFVRCVATVQTLHLQFRKLARFCTCRRLWQLLLSCRLQGPSTQMFWLLAWCRQAFICSLEVATCARLAERGASRHATATESPGVTHTYFVLRHLSQR
jgi:hypothetical protein